MSGDIESVSEWIESMKGGSSAAQERLWRRYYYQLIDSARRMLREKKKRSDFDEEDVLQSVFLNLFQRAESGQFPALMDRDGLWRLLIVMTECRIKTKVRDANAKKRGGDVSHVDVNTTGSDGSKLFFDAPESPVPAPGTTEELVNTVEEVLGDCGELEKEIARMRMEGYSIEEISEVVDRAPVTINRKIKYLKNKLRNAIENA